MVQRFVNATAGFLAVGLMTVGVARADLVTISITNPGSSSFSLTPLWYGFHAGTYDIFDSGQPVSMALEALAEDGIVGGLQSDFTSAAPAGQQGVLAAPAGFPGAPVIEPGESASFVFDRVLVNRFLSFASMVIPSNDAFIAPPNAVEIFNPDGSFVGGGNTRTLNILYEQIWDAGTEVNDTMGAAFSLVGGMSTDENGVAHLLPSGGLSNFAGTFTAANTEITNLFTPGSTVATITVSTVPEPASGLLMSVALLSLVSVRRRK